MPTDAAKDAQASPAGAKAPATDDFETARKAVEDTAAIGGGLWLSYLFVLFYLGIAAGAVTHADLFLKNPVKVPFLNIELPLLAFFFLAPLLLLLTRAYTLVHLVLLARRVEQFNAIKSLPGSWRRRQLPSKIFVQFLGAQEEDRYGPFGLLLGAILWVTLVVAPVALYLLLEISSFLRDPWIGARSRLIGPTFCASPTRGRMQTMLRCAGLSSGRSQKVRTVTGLSNGSRSSIARARATTSPPAIPRPTRRTPSQTGRKRSRQQRSTRALTPRLLPQSSAASSAPMKLIAFTCCAGCYRPNASSKPAPKCPRWQSAL